MKKKILTVLFCVIAVALAGYFVFRKQIPSFGLNYIISEDKTHYYVSMGDCYSKNVVIPSKYEGLPVSIVADSGFRPNSDRFFTNNSDARKAIKSVVLGKNVTEIEGDAFYGCTNLSRIEIGEDVTSIGNDAFKECYSLKEVHYKGSIEDWCKISFRNEYANPLCCGATLYIKAKPVKDLVIPESVTEINDYAFYGCSIDSIKIENPQVCIGHSVFEQSKYLTNEENWKDGALYAGDTLIKVKPEAAVGSYKVQAGTTIICGGAFEECNRLLRVELPEGLVAIGAEAFDGCIYLNEINFPSSVTVIENFAFANCENLSNVVIPSGIKKLGAGAFSMCKSLTSIVIPEGITKIERYTFYFCYGLTNVVIPNTVTSIESYAFCYCEDLQSIVIPDSVTTIEDDAFINCSQLQTVVIGKGLAHVGDMAFDCCESIERVYYKGSKSDWGKIYIQPRKSDYIGRDNMDLINATRYYYSETTPTVEGNFWYYNENGEIAVW